MITKSMVSVSLVGLFACGGANGTSPDATGGSGSGSGSGSTPDAAIINSTTPVIPVPTGVCPTITAGDVTFAPAGVPPRKVKLAFDPAKVGTGPLILYWYATGSGT